MDMIRRWLWPPLARAVTVILVGAQLAIVIAFVLSYVERGRRITDLETALCEERVAKLSRLAVPQTSCPDADKILARVLPQRWMPLAETPSSRVPTRTVDYRPRPEEPQASPR
jgi:hypothetical protein